MSSTAAAPPPPPPPAPAPAPTSNPTSASTNVEPGPSTSTAPAPLPQPQPQPQPQPTGPCALPFPTTELSRLLPPSLFRLYEKLKFRKEVESAKIDGLEECPFCDWVVVIDVGVEEERVLRCGNKDCGVVSCRQCKKKEHLPKSCQEAEADKHIDKRVMIEEAMTQALMRVCPKCKKAFIKEDGCNKMTCPHCRTMSCYVCRQVVTGYDHFHNQQQPGMPVGSSSRKPKCPLWDSVAHRHSEEVKKAYEEALAKLKESNPDVEIGKDIKVDLPEAPPPPVPGQHPAGYIDPYALARGQHPHAFGGVHWGGGRHLGQGMNHHLNPNHPNHQHHLNFANVMNQYMLNRYIPPLQPPAPVIPPNIDPAPLRLERERLRERLRERRVRLRREERYLVTAERREEEAREVLRAREGAAGMASARAARTRTGAGAGGIGAGVGVSAADARAIEEARNLVRHRAVERAARMVQVENLRREVGEGEREVEGVERMLARREEEAERWRAERRREEEGQVQRMREAEREAERELEREVQRWREAEVRRRQEREVEVQRERQRQRRERQRERGRAMEAELGREREVLERRLVEREREREMQREGERLLRVLAEEERERRGNAGAGTGAGGAKRKRRG
ncbi:hypothetical protein CC1G_14060 [Coprinopsis cinerea okayama7|uniref:RING-type domain-containing protein n=1 Tax=Coprinopsis cinerea (strain Okayama-7 / 130 / ATCC MYA-4618 / FGSC 9003) TaxID=240176 RepID=D6RL33_COPC7|nr:hypothetical protein CC1G_14060 [Coprinopsis cinerea okayama7\|eukprot:XP_002911528.1 hypothetical protein CC1G_14060 [Coprinopsis cinerea okayama7\